MLGVKGIKTMPYTNKSASPNAAEKRQCLGGMDHPDAPAHVRIDRCPEDRQQPTV